MQETKDDDLITHKWNRSLVTISTDIFLISFALEVIIFIVLWNNDTFSMPMWQHFIFKIALPSLLSCIVVLIMRKSLEADDSSRIGRRRNAIICYGFFLICAIISIVHNYYHVAWVIPGTCQFVVSIYADKKLIKRIFNISWYVLALTFIYAAVEGLYPMAYFFVSLICCIAFNFVSYIVANLLVEYHKEQIDYINHNYIRYKHLVTELSTDSMTGLFNKKTLVKNIDEYIATNKENLRLCIAMLDFDHFKSINDTYGHMSGDKVIYRFVELLNKLKENGVVGYRYGGEEFIALIKDNSIDEVANILDEFREEFAKEVYSFDMNVRVTLSIGLAEYTPGIGTSELIKKADDALYKAKKEGRNRIVIL